MSRIKIYKNNNWEYADEGAVSQAVPDMSFYNRFSNNGVYGYVLGRTDSQSPVTRSEAGAFSMYWRDESFYGSKITWSGLHQAFIIQEEGFYNYQAAVAMIEGSGEYATLFQVWNGSTWLDNGSEDFGSYLGGRRGKTISGMRKFKPGDMVRVKVYKPGTANCKYGISRDEDCYFAISKVQDLQNTSVTPRYSNQRIVKELTLTGSGGNTAPNKMLQVGAAIPAEFQGRKFKATFNFTFDRQNCTTNDVFTFQIYVREWSNSLNTYARNDWLYNKEVGYWHNYLSLTTICDNTLGNKNHIEVAIRDRNNRMTDSNKNLVLFNNAGSLILETID